MEAAHSHATGMNGYFWGSVFFLILQWVLAIIRVYVRAGIVRKFGADDITMLITLILSTGYIGCILGVARLSRVSPVWDIPYANLNPAVHAMVAGETLYIAAASMLKVSLGLLLLRVLVQKWQRIVIYVTVTICCAYGTGYFFVALFACGNPNDYLINALSRHCISNSAIYGTSYTHAILNAVADIIFACLPVALLWNADMPRRAKISVGMILVLGSIGCVFTIVRIAFIHYLAAVSATYFVTGQPIALTSSGELSIGITCICLATFKPLVHRFLYRDDLYSRPSRTHDSVQPEMEITEPAPASSGWRQSWRNSWRNGPASARLSSSTSRTHDAKWGPEYRTEFKTLNAHVEESPRTPSEQAWSAREWPASSHTPSNPAHSHRFSGISDTYSSAKSPV